MPVERSTVLIDAPQRTVAGVLRDVEASAEALGRGRHWMVSPVRLLAPGDEVSFGARLLPGVRTPLRMVVKAVSVHGMVAELAEGPVRELVHTVALTATPVGTLLEDELRWAAPFGPLGRAAGLRVLARRALWARAGVVRERSAALRAAPVVVATALVRERRLLAARRTRPPGLAGRWELPGGRVEAGESERDAVVRECREELGTEVLVTGRLGTDLPIAAGVLRVYMAELAPGAAEPRAVEHSALRWVVADEVPEVAWLEADRAVVPDLVALLVGAAE